MLLKIYLKVTYAQCDCIDLKDMVLVIIMAVAPASSAEDNEK